jgi:hypothetical protein
MYKKIVVVAMASLTMNLMACKSTPVDPVIQAESILLDDITPTEALESTKQGKEQLDKVRYMAQNLMGYGDRKEFTKSLSDEVEGWSPLNTSIGFAASSAITGNPFSVEGSGTAVAVTFALEAVSFIFDGAAEEISQMWLPSEVGGREITSTLMAQDVALEQTLRVLETTMTKFGYELSPIGIMAAGSIGEGTEGLREGVHMMNAVVTDATRAVFKENKPYPYAPERLLLIVGDFPYKKVEKPDPLTALVLGFEPAYESRYAGASIKMFGGVKKDLSGAVIRTKVGNIEFDDAERDLWMTSYGRDINRDISSQMPWVQGEDENSRRAIVAGGEVYTFFSTSPSGFINARFNN